MEHIQILHKGTNRNMFSNEIYQKIIDTSFCVHEAYHVSMDVFMMPLNFSLNLRLLRRMDGVAMTWEILYLNRMVGSVAAS